VNVLFVNLAAEWGGGEGWTLRTALGLARLHDDRVRLLCRRGSPLAETAHGRGVELEPIPVGVDYSPSTITRIAHSLRRHRDEVVVVHHNKDLRTAGPAALLLGRPVVHRNGYPILRDNLRHRIATGFTTRVLTNSVRIRDRYHSFPWFRTPVDVVPNGVALPEPIPDTRAELARLAGISPERKLLLYAGRLTGIKRVDLLLEALASLPQASPWNLIVLGEGSQRGALERTRGELGLEERVHFTGFHPDSRELTAGADLVALPSLEEGMPNALMEAMANATPVAASPVGDVPELLDGGRAGWLVPVGDADAWARLLRETDDETLRATGRAGRERIRDHYRFESMIEGVRGCLLQALAAGRADR
jgi:glycosyltransferase involved in cell wall biosynthesis